MIQFKNSTHRFSNPLQDSMIQSASSIHWLSVLLYNFLEITSHFRNSLNIISETWHLLVYSLYNCHMTFKRLGLLQYLCQLPPKNSCGMSLFKGAPVKNLLSSLSSQINKLNIVCTSFWRINVGYFLTYCSNTERTNCICWAIISLYNSHEMMLWGTERRCATLLKCWWLK